jgi:hypothetical protein
MSYAGSLDFGIVAARKALPEPRKLAQALLEAHAELLQRIETPSAAKKKPAVNRKKAATRT